VVVVVVMALVAWPILCKGLQPPIIGAVGTGREEEGEGEEEEEEREEREEGVGEGGTLQL
jgi:hypothetical protein